MAAVVDPRCKNLNWLEEHQRTFIFSEFSSEVQECTKYLSSYSTNNYRDQEPPKKRSKVKVIESIDILFALNGTNNMQQSGSGLPIQDELAGYRVEPEISIQSNPLQWWATHESRYPRISILAKKYLPIPASNAPSERVFSTTKEIIDRKRGRLLPENLEKIIFLYYNRSFLND